MQTVTRPNLTLVPDTPAKDPFIPEVAGVLLAAGFPPARIPWLGLPAPAAVELSATMGPARVHAAHVTGPAGGYHRAVPLGVPS